MYFTYVRILIPFLFLLRELQGSRNIFSYNAVTEATRVLHFHTSSARNCSTTLGQLYRIRDKQREDENYLQNPVTSTKLILLLRSSSIKYCGIMAGVRLKQAGLYPDRELLKGKVEVLINMMESYRYTFSDLVSLAPEIRYGYEDLLILSTAVSRTESPPEILLKYQAMLLSQVPAEKRDSWLYKEAEAKMKEEYHIVEFKRLCSAHKDTVGTKKCFIEQRGFERYHTEILSEVPFVALYHGFVTERERLLFQEDLSKVTYEKGTVMDKDNAEEETVNFRDEVVVGENDRFQSLSNRFDDVVQLSRDDTLLEIYKYRLGGEHSPHVDFYTETDLKKQAEKGSYDGNRLAIALVFLGKLELGGGFAMPELGIYVAPSPGTLLLWWNVDLDGNNSPESIHGGCPVYIGTKMIAITEYNFNEQHVPNLPHLQCKIKS